MTIPQLLVRDGYWPTTRGPRRNVSNKLDVAITPHEGIPANEWYIWNNKVGGYPGYQLSVGLYFPGNKAYINNVQVTNCTATGTRDGR